jgi:aminoglycoside phosphotransferase (APT) family kinase protein
VQPLALEREAAFSHWLATECGIEGARLGRLLAGGNSNVTRLVDTPTGQLVLRHPPVDVVSDKAAAGISREFTALQALYGEAPVPRPVAWCDDRTILGQPFALTEWIDGVALTTEVPSEYPSGTASIDRLGEEMIAGLAAVHKVAWETALPEKFGRSSGFVERQIDRWLDVREKHRARDLPLLEQIGVWLRENEPVSDRTSIIHCDFHLDNCLVDRASPRLKAILDWEMATVGDPLVDLGLCLFFWKRDAYDALGFPFVQGVSNHPSVVDRARLADLWSELSGFDNRDLPYFMVFSAWRLAAIVEGAFVLYREGKVDSQYARNLEQDVPNLLRETSALIDRGGR